MLGCIALTFSQVKICTNIVTHLMQYNMFWNLSHQAPAIAMLFCYEGQSGSCADQYGYGWHRIISYAIIAAPLSIAYVRRSNGAMVRRRSKIISL